MLVKIFFTLGLLAVSISTLAQSTISGTWMLEGPGTESEIARRRVPPEFGQIPMRQLR